MTVLITWTRKLRSAVLSVLFAGLVVGVFVGFLSIREYVRGTPVERGAAVETPPLPPMQVSGGFDAPELRAAGLATDGWMADMASVELTQTAGAASLVVRGMVPLIDNPAHTTELRVLVDGQEVAHQTLGLGDFELRAPAAATADGTRRVELRSSSTQQLPAPDTRHVGALIQSIGFEAPVAAQAAAAATAVPTLSGSVPPQAITDPHTALGNPTLQATGLDGDGWLAGASSFTLAQPATASALVVQGMVPRVNDGAYTAEIRILVDGQEVTRQTLRLGDFQVRASVPPGEAGQRRVELRFSATQQLPAPDSRQVGARLSYAGFEGS